MAEDIACDTTFLIDLQRSLRSRAGMAAREFLRTHARDRFFLPVVALGEFAAGYADERDQTFVETVRHFAVLPVDGSIALVYRDLFRALQSVGKLIGAKDLWIAATAVHHNLPLLTSNKAEFLRIRPLRVLSY
jgi:predicted nucleic acid-binding protein